MQKLKITFINGNLFSVPEKAVSEHPVGNPGGKR